MQRMMIRDGTKRRSLTRVSERELLRMTGCNVVIFLFARDDDDSLLGMIFFVSLIWYCHCWRLFLSFSRLNCRFWVWFNCEVLVGKCYHIILRRVAFSFIFFSLLCVCC